MARSSARMKKVVLASGSPRRRELMSWAGIPFEVWVSEVDETPLKNETPRQMVARLSREKAKAVEKILRGRMKESWIVAADTTVVSPRGKILGKPAGRAEAISMLRELSGKTHRVLTGFACIRNKKCISQVVSTAVKFRKLSDKQIHDYVKRGESMDKAGAYAAQGFGMVLIESIRGSYTNVVGLPMAEVLAILVGEKKRSFD